MLSRTKQFMMTVSETEKLSDIPKTRRFVDYLEHKASSEIANFPFIRHFKEGKCTDITYKQFRNCVNSAADQLKESISRDFVVNDDKITTIGYLSNSGSDYPLNIFALMSLNLTPIFISPRNSINILLHLLKAGDTKVLVYSEDYEEKAQEIKRNIPYITLVPNVTYKSVKVDNFAPVTPLVSMDKYNGDCSEHVMVIIHSSGSTSYPKLIKLSNRYFFTLVRRGISEYNLDDPSYSVLNCAPFFHLYGFGNFIRSLAYNLTVSFPSSQNMTGKSLLKDSKVVKASLMISLPYLLKQIYEHCIQETSGETWNYLAEFEKICAAGAPLPTVISEDFKLHNVNILNGYGSTEIGVIAASSSVRSSSDFQILHLKEGLKYKQIFETEDTFRLIIDPTDEGLATGMCQPGSEGYPTGDLYKVVNRDSPHKNEFIILGRTDDTIVHISGEKTNPIPIEQDIASSPYIQACLVYGKDKLNCACIVQLNNEISSKTPLLELYDEVFSVINKANNNAPSHSKILPELTYILPLVPSKSFPVTPKGNVIRKKAGELFQEEIEELYKKFVQYDEKIDKKQLGEISIQRIEIDINFLFENVTSKRLRANISFFNQSLDSLTSVKLRNLISERYPEAKLTINSIYENDTLEKLSNHIFNLLNNSIKVKTIESHIKDVEQLVTEYSKFENFTVPSKFIKPLAKDEKLNVLITGANGSLGQFIIKSLLQNPNVGKIYGLARAKDQAEALKRIRIGFSERKINLTEQQWSQIVALPYSSDSPQLGLDDETYTTVLNSVDIIYHVAWRMDFLKGLFAFRDNIESTVNLLRISAFSPRKPLFGFVSTVGATIPLLESTNIKELQLHTSLKNLASCTGYNLSKLVSEVLTYKWHHRFNIPTDIYRVGQISGDTINGVWNLNEHIPLLIKGIQTMKVAPSNFGENTSWIPVDVAANGITEISFNPNNKHEITISHIVNPYSTSWLDILQSLKLCGIEFEVVDSYKFIEILNSPEYQNVDINPLASLTDFFSNIFTVKKFSYSMDTQQTQKLSKNIAGCKSTDTALFNNFISYWSEIGFIKKCST